MNNGSKFVDERIITNLLGSVVDIDTLMGAFFSNHSEPVIKALVQKCNNADQVKVLLDKMNYNVRGRFITGKSLLGEIERDIIDGFMTKDNIEHFETNLVGAPAMFEGSLDSSSKQIDYSSVQTVYPYFSQKKEQLMSLEQTQTLGKAV